MIVRLDSTLCKILLSKRMMWAWGFWWIEAVRVGQVYNGFVRITFRIPKRNKINWM
jgi:hypothetical protein